VSDDRPDALHLYSTSEAASRLGVAAVTVALWARSGRLPPRGTNGSQGDRLFDLLPERGGSAGIRKGRESRIAGDPRSTREGERALLDVGCSDRPGHPAVDRLDD
jgi:hypothetical protein